MNPHELEFIIRKVLSDELQTPFFIALVAGIALPFLAAYLGSYFAAKGKNLATKEDIRILEGQVAATTKVAEDIKAEVGKVQKQWERKRELYADLLEALYRVLHTASTAIDYERRIANAEDERFRNMLMEKQRALGNEERPHMDSIIRIRGIGELMFPTDVTKALDELNMAFTKAQEQRDHFEFLKARYEAADKAHSLIVGAAKKDLGL